jgi:hypothetical protein
MNDPEVTKYLGTRGEQTEVMIADYVSKCILDMNTTLMAIMIKTRSEGGLAHIGNVKVVYQPDHYKGTLSLMIGEKVFWGKGFGREVIRGVTDYCFMNGYGGLNPELHKLGMFRKIQAGILSPNIGSLIAFLFAGYDIECTMFEDRMLADCETVVNSIWVCKFNK